MTAINITDLNNAKLDVDHIAEMATSLDPTCTDRLGNVKQTMSAAGNAVAVTAAGTATTARIAAEAARDAAQLSAGIYATTAAGLAATVNGEYFNIPSADELEYLILYKNVSGTELEIKRYPSVNAIALIQEPVAIDHRDGILIFVAKLTGQVAGEITEAGTLFFKRAAAYITDVFSPDGSVGATQAGATGGLFTLSDTDGRIPFEVDESGVTHIAKLNLLDPLDAVTVDATTSQYGGYRGDTLENLAEHVGLAGNFNRYGTAMRNPIGADLRRLGAVVTPLAGTYRSGMVEGPCVWQDTDQLYHMVFVAYSGTAASPLIASVGHAVSKDLVNWTVDAAPLFEGSGIDGSPDKIGITGPVMYKGEDGTYYLYYIGLPLAGYEQGTKTVCLATASSLSGPWTRFGTVVGLGAAAWRSQAIYHISIVLRRGIYYMFFNAAGTGTGTSSTGSERIGYATSTSLAGPWTVDDVNSPLITTVDGTWESKIVGDPAIWFDEGTGEWRMAYFGFDTNNASEGYAWTTDEEFPLNWRKRADNPILTKQANSTWELGYAHKPFIFKVGSTIHHYYTGTGTGSKRGICMAVSGAGISRQWIGDQDGYTRYIAASPAGNALDRYKRDDDSGALFAAGYNGVTQSYQIGRIAGNGLAASLTFNTDGENVAVGAQTALATTATTGFLWVPSINGTPTGVPTADATVKGARIAMCFDTVNNRLYHYNGSWKFVTLT